LGEPVTPIGITAAALIMQFSLVVIMFAAAFIMRIGVRHSPFWREGQDTSASLWLLIAFSLLTIGILLISEEFSTMWVPLFGSVDLPGLSWSASLAVVFTADLVCISALAAATGGSSLSPFAPLYFVMPPLSIFLRSSLVQVVCYFLLASVLFSLGLRSARGIDLGVSEMRARTASWVVAIACFALATLVGYLTRPLP